MPQAKDKIFKRLRYSAVVVKGKLNTTVKSGSK